MEPSKLFDGELCAPEIALLRDHPRIGERAKKWIATCSRVFPHSVALRVLNDSNFDDILAIWSDQVAKTRNPEAPPSEAVARTFSANGVLGRPHHQLICTESGLLAKFARIDGHFAKDTKILLVGDDDQLLPLLVEAGYTQVSALDIDADLVRSLQERCGDRARVRVHDLNNSAPAEWIDDYALIVMDPPYSVDGADLFLRGALQFAAPRSQPKIQMYCASAGLTRDGIAELTRRISAQGYRLARFESGVCRYPYPKTTRYLFIGLYAAAAVAFRFPKGFNASLIPPAICSDLWHLERG